MMPELAKMTTKGQVVIPVEIRKALGIKQGSQLAVSTVNNLIILKKIEVTDPLEEFARLNRIGSIAAKKKGVRTEADVVNIIRAFRKTAKNSP